MKGGKDERMRMRKGAELQMSATELHKKGKLEDCIPGYLESLKFTMNRRARFVTFCNLANAYMKRAENVRSRRSDGSRSPSPA